jgi:hypothetical protein
MLNPFTVEWIQTGAGRTSSHYPTMKDAVEGCAIVVTEDVAIGMAQRVLDLVNSSPSTPAASQIVHAIGFVRIRDNRLSKDKK